MSCFLGETLAPWGVDALRLRFFLPRSEDDEELLLLLLLSLLLLLRLRLRRCFEGLHSSQELESEINFIDFIMLFHKICINICHFFN